MFYKYGFGLELRCLEFLASLCAERMCSHGMPTSKSPALTPLIGFSLLLYILRCLALASAKLLFTSL
ncbi:hypothetical protein BpHYR1_028500 [Brachionus plicatilis]|uniref:Uncharacterized protein n=1 Tax=Brachionus plicatilis TaxID=10195 RepID=A0A3M7Q1V5_BRAPC|nr:hypothetical protein BpHYR1_028500 [Brachionus plicatilis]